MAGLWEQLITAANSCLWGLQMVSSRRNFKTRPPSSSLLDGLSVFTGLVIKLGYKVRNKQWLVTEIPRPWQWWCSGSWSAENLALNQALHSLQQAGKPDKR